MFVYIYLDMDFFIDLDLANYIKKFYYLFVIPIIYKIIIIEKTVSEKNS